jgi:L-seryl-tRNA(Ser) seleniumtransferase
MSSLRDLPSVDQILQTAIASRCIAEFGRPLTVEAVRYTLDEARTRHQPGALTPNQDELLERLDDTLRSWTNPSLQPVINATGVVLHTNLGRAPLSLPAVQAAQDVSAAYSTLEFDLAKGRRGSRLEHTEALLRRITGAQAAIVVNNNAAAVLLALTALARRRFVVIARSQLVEIGGGFRVPDVLKQSGARLLEVGTTNRVHLSDFEAALEEKPAMILRAHRSNFLLLGYVSEPGLRELAGLAHRAGIPLVDDLGSGSLLDTARFGLGHEPMVQESLAAGVDLVCFSGDKLLGGPQAGIIVGRADLVAALKKHPLARALRADKLCLSALSATLLHYLKDEAELQIPIWRMISASPEQLRTRAQDWARALGQGQVLPGESTVGGGSLPGEMLPTFLFALDVKSPNSLLARLRLASPPIIARLENDLVLLDPRTVLPEQEDALLVGIKMALGF